ncbi:MAG TPA: hypothetical protein VG452_06750 [Egibacteraceae bacterium]|nr:hypothetical protein [Egibacteraceae bacterium]
MGSDDGQGQGATAAQLLRRPTMLPVVQTRPRDEPAPPVDTPALFEAFQAAYERMRTAGKLLFGASVNVHALAELLLSKGVITPQELDDGRQAAVDDVQNAYVEAGLGVKLAVGADDKYACSAEGPARHRLRRAHPAVQGRLLHVPVGAQRTGRRRGHRPVGPDESLRQPRRRRRLLRPLRRRQQGLHRLRRPPDDLPHLRLPQRHPHLARLRRQGGQPDLERHLAEKRGAEPGT